MATQDISRRLLQPEKRYASARMQQGRVILDSDLNEAELLGDEDRRAVLVDAVGPHGSSTAGFSIAAVQTDVYDFTIVAGSYFLGGLRHETVSEKFLAQADWRQSSRTDLTAAIPTLPLVARNDLVYMIGWEQTVSAVEDLELVEHALGGRDTSVRVRRMHRVYVLPNTVVSDCAGAFAKLVDELTPGPHTFDSEEHELKSAARLAVTLASGVPDDPCGPTTVTGYLGGENQAIRVQMIAADRFLWGFDNASPLYRVTASRSEGVLTIEFLTPPQEQALFPLRGQIVEILPWGAKLANGEHIADHPIAPGVGGGVYVRALATYNPATKKMTASIPDSTRFDAMLAWFGALPADKRYFYLRVWNGTASPDTQLGISTSASYVLPNTGLKVEILGPGIVGDHWIIAARPNTPTQLVPWDLGNAAGVPPHGPRRFYSPIGMLRWTFAGAVRQVKVGACRRPFRPLTRLHGCCNVTVGDGTTSFGDYTRINDAIAALPAGEPGKVCILPGIYEERVVLDHRSRLVIEGCGARTVIRTPPDNTTSQGLITVIAGNDVTLRDLKLEATGQFGVLLLPGTAGAVDPCRKITLEKLDITTRRDAGLPAPKNLALPTTSAPFPMCTFAALDANEVRLLACNFTEVGDLSAAANVLLARCKAVLVRRCKIVSPPGAGSISKAWGGLQIAGGCSDVEVERCHIEGGIGHGITLGSAYPLVPADDPAAPYNTGNDKTMTPPGDCPAVHGGFGADGRTIGAADDPPVFVPDVGPHDVRIRRNRIRGMGGSGISVLGFWPEQDEASLEQIQTHDLVIDDNTIENNCTHPPDEPLLAPLREVAAYGGIVLADADRLRIHDNLIRGNGPDHRYPVCGIYLLNGENVVVEDNQIHDNGRRVPGSGYAGHRAGIALQFVGRELAGDVAAPDLSQPAARVRGNTVVQPVGRALQIYGIGPMFVEGNVLVSRGLEGNIARARRYAAHCIELKNLGQSPELSLTGTVPAELAIFVAPALEPSPLPFADELIDGRILFTDNQVRFEPVSGTADDIFCVNRFQSHGDVAVLNNQFLAVLPTGEGQIATDTIVTAWSTRTSHNRWEDPSYFLSGTVGPRATDTSAQTLARWNITSHNQASRCIHADVAATTITSSNPMVNNQIFADAGCDLIPQIVGLLEDP